MFWSIFASQNLECVFDNVLTTIWLCSYFRILVQHPEFLDVQVCISATMMRPQEPEKTGGVTRQAPGQHEATVL